MPNDSRRTPQALYDRLDAIFHFTLDAAADVVNAKCGAYYSLDGINGLTAPWFSSTWCNPPYGRGEIIQWIAKARAELKAHHNSVLLLPSDTSTKWFRELVRPMPGHATALFFLHGRLRFGLADGTVDGPSKFGSVLAIYGYGLKERVALHKMEGWYVAP